jgi:hypothetical protein
MLRYPGWVITSGAELLAIASWTTRSRVLLLAWIRPERGGVFDCDRGLLLWALRLRTAGASLVTLVRMLMRMVVWLLPRCLCAAVLREGGYWRQDEGRENHAKECTHRDSRRFPHAYLPQRPAKRRARC